MRCRKIPFDRTVQKRAVPCGFRGCKSQNAKCKIGRSGRNPGAENVDWQPMARDARDGQRFSRTEAVFTSFINPFVGEEGGGRHEGTTVRSMLLRGGMEVRSLERTSIQPRAAILAAVRFEQKTGAKTTKKPRIYTNQHEWFFSRFLRLFSHRFND